MTTIDGCGDWVDSSVLITGGSGFIGTRLVSALTMAGARVVNLDRRPSRLAPDPSVTAICGDVCDTDVLSDAMEREEIDVVFHLAAQPIMDAATRDPLRTMMLNVNGTAAVAESLRRLGRRIPLVFSSSAAVYGARGDGEPLAEDAASGPMSTYGASKRAAEEVLRGYATAHGQTTIMCRLMNTYGPGDRHSSRLVPRAIQMLNRGTSYDFGPRGDGSAQLDFVYVDDAVQALMRAGHVMRFRGGLEVVNVGTGTATSVTAIAERLAELAGSALTPTFSGPRVERAYVKRLEMSHALGLLGWKAATDVPDGLALTWLSGANRQLVPSG